MYRLSELNNSLGQCTPVCMASSTSDGSYFCTDERHLAKNNSKVPLSLRRSVSRTQNCFFTYLSSIRRGMHDKGQVVRRRRDPAALTMIVWGCVYVCVCVNVRVVGVWGSITVRQVTWGNSFHCTASMFDCFHTAVCNPSGFFFDEYVQTQTKLYRSAHPAHCQSPGPSSSVGWWQRLMHPSQHPGLRRERK